MGHRISGAAGGRDPRNCRPDARGWSRARGRPLLSATLALAGLSVGGTAVADVGTIAHDSLRTGWDHDEPGLSPSAVASSNFGKLFSATVDGQVYAQPLVVGTTVIAATENNAVYGLDSATGAAKWTRKLGPAWPASTVGCGDLTPNIGITSTPVYDPATKSVFLLAKTNDGATAQLPHWYMHSLDVATGAEKPGFPVVIDGAPTNDPTRPFNAMTAMQRPGLLLMNGVVYAGFASHCDYTPFVGYVVGVSTSRPADDDVGDRIRQRQRGGRDLAVRRRTGVRRSRSDPAHHGERHFPEARPGHRSPPPPWRSRWSGSGSAVTAT